MSPLGCWARQVLSTDSRGGVMAYPVDLGGGTLRPSGLGRVGGEELADDLADPEAEELALAEPARAALLVCGLRKCDTAFPVEVVGLQLLPAKSRIMWPSCVLWKVDSWTLPSYVWPLITLDSSGDVKSDSSTGKFQRCVPALMNETHAQLANRWGGLS